MTSNIKPISEPLIILTDDLPKPETDQDRSRKMFESIYSQDQDIEDYPHGWIQWKGTEACIDLHCECGHHGHFDGEFFYFYECPKCQRRYAVGQNVKLILLTTEQCEYAESNGVGFKTDEEDD
jgi:hypothetical protein